MSDYREFIRNYLLDGGYGVYARIVVLYSDQLLELGTPSAFRRWLATELDIPLEKINLSSLNSAIGQHRKKQTSLSHNEASLTDEFKGSPANKSDRGFKFSKSGPSDDGSRINEV